MSRGKLLLVKNVLAADSEDFREPRVTDILIEDDTIVCVDSNQNVPDAEVLERKDCIALPGPFDLHMHGRDHEEAEAETMATLAKCALYGGYSGGLLMANSSPPPDTADIYSERREELEALSPLDLRLAAPVTRGRQGQQLVDFEQLRAAGARVFTDDGSPMSDEIARQAFLEAAKYGVAVMEHCEDIELRRTAGPINDGPVARYLGVPGISPEVEARMVERDLKIGLELGVPVGLHHVSRARSYELIREYRAKGVQVVCEVTVHNLIFSELQVLISGANAKMNPPEGSTEDVIACNEALRDGIVNFLVTDHAPHPRYKKELGLTDSAFGIIGAQVALPLLVDRLVKSGAQTLAAITKAMCYNPARFMGVTDRGLIRPGMKAYIAIIDPNCDWCFDDYTSYSKSCNSPVYGEMMHTMVIDNIVRGQVFSLF